MSQMLWLCLQEVIVSERRFQYEAEVKANPQNYDTWFDYIRLEESAGDHDKVISCFKFAERILAVSLSSSQVCLPLMLKCTCQQETSRY